MLCSAVQAWAVRVGAGTRVVALLQLQEQIMLEITGGEPRILRLICGLPRARHNLRNYMAVMVGLALQTAGRLADVWAVSGVATLLAGTRKGGGG